MVFGLWGVISGKIGFGMLVGIIIILGIVVDDIIYFLVKYKYGCEQLKLNNYCSVEYVMDIVGVVMIFIIVMMVIMFILLLFFDFVFNQDLGLIMIIIIICVVLVDFILLLVILLKIFGDQDMELVGSGQ